MLGHWKKFVLVLGLAGLMAFVMVTASEAGPLQQEPLPDECHECHETIQMHWEESGHGQAMANPAFLEAWRAEGEPAECLACHTTGFDETTETWEEEGVTCDACHQMPENSPHHPEMVMPTDVSSRSCGNCHIDTHAEWTISQHGEAELTCNRCHNPHTTSLKTESVQELCIACHNEEAHFFSFTGHAEEGLLCTDCHLRVSDSPIGEGHGQRQHTFAVDLATCSECHDGDMHSPMVTMVDDTSQPDMTAVLVSSDAELAPPPPVRMAQNGVAYAVEPALAAQPTGGVNGPFSYLVPAGLGLIFGMMLAPWMEGLYRRRRYGRRR